MLIMEDDDDDHHRNASEAFQCGNWQAQNLPVIRPVNVVMPEVISNHHGTIIVVYCIPYKIINRCNQRIFFAAINYILYFLHKNVFITCYANIKHFWGAYNFLSGPTTV